MRHAGAVQTTPDVRLREAVPTDAFSVGALHIQAEREQGRVPPPGFLDRFADAWLRDRARRTWVAEESAGRPVGAVHGTRVQGLPGTDGPAPVWFHVGFLYVAADRRGQGVGERLLRALVGWAAADGVTCLRLDTVPEAATLLARVGFEAPSAPCAELRLTRSPGRTA